MTHNKLKLNTVFFLLTIVSILIFVVVIFSNNHALNEEIYNVALQELEGVSGQIQAELNEYINDEHDDLTLLAGALATNNVADDDTIEFLNGQSQVGDFENVYHVQLDANGMSIDGNLENFSQNAAFLGVLQDEVEVSAPHTSSRTGKIVLDIAVPVQKNGELTSVLLGEASIESVYASAKSLITKNGFSLILAPNGEVLYSTDSQFSTLDDFDSNEVVLLGDTSFETMRSDLENGQNGNLYYEVNGVANIALYSPIEQTPWTLVVSLEEDEINNELHTLITSIVHTSLAVVFLLMLFTIYSWFSRRDSIKTIEKTAYYDALTGLPNLIKLKKHMATVLKNNQTKPYVIIKCDVENFKAINELFGYEVGNRVLHAFNTISSAVKEKTLIVARTGVDEFIFFSGNHFMDHLENETAMYEEYFKKLIPELSGYELSFKYGRYFIELGDTDVDDIITKVGIAHTMAKSKKGQVIYDYDDTYKTQMIERVEIANKMKSALENGEFKVFLQPKMRVSDGQIIGAEALVRWVEANGNMIFPDKFIPQFEKNGFIVELDKYMVESTCKVMRKWREEGRNLLPISINCSRLNLANPNFVLDVAKIVDEYEIPHHYIEIELTESTIIENEEVLEKLFFDLHEHGFSVSIDDFGSGYSSLGLLKNLKADTLKLDRSFFTDNKDTVRGELVVDGIVKLSQSLNMLVVAEGVEEEEQIDFLKFIGCDAAQGYYFAKPMCISDFETQFGQKIQELTKPHLIQEGALSSVTQRNNNQTLELTLKILNSVKIPSTLFEDIYCKG